MNLYEKSALEPRRRSKRELKDSCFDGFEYKGYRVRRAILRGKFPVSGLPEAGSGARP